MSQETIQGAPEQLRARIREIVATVLEVEPGELTDTGAFVEDYDADSLLLIEMFARFERELRVKIPPKEVGELQNLQAAYDLVARHAGTGDGGA
jgi:acyl carrier protein